MQHSEKTSKNLVWYLEQQLDIQLDMLKLIALGITIGGIKTPLGFIKATAGKPLISKEFAK